MTTDSPGRSGNARLMIVFAMVVFGTIGLFVRAIPLASAEIALYRAALAALALTGYLLIRREKPNREAIKRRGPLLLLSGIIMGFNWMVLFEAYRNTTVSIATLSYYVAPILMTVGSALFFKEKVSRWQGFCFTMAVLGLGLLIWVPGGASGAHVLGVGLGLLAALMYATVVLLNKAIGDLGAVYRTLLQFAAATAVLTPYVLLTGGFHLGALQVSGWAALITVGVFHTGVTYCVYFSAVRRLRGREVAILSFIDPLVAVLLSAVFLKEPFTPLQMLGGAMILGFTFVSDRRGKRAEVAPRGD